MGDDLGATGFRDWFKDFKRESSVYGAQILALLIPGHHAKTISVHTHKTGNLNSWVGDDFALLIEQGRIQLARQRQDIENVRNRSQFLFTTTLGMLALAFAALPEVAKSLGAFLVWATAVMVALVALLGAAGVVVARKDFREIDTTLVSQQNSPVQEAVAVAYAESISAGENTVATQITVYRNAVTILILSFVGLAVSWMLAFAA